jgi:hypothetical protein
LVDLSLQAAPSSPAAKVRHKVLTRTLLQMKLQSDPQAPHLIIKPRLAVSLLGVPHDVEPDALVASSQDRFYRVVELKSYADRDGETDQADIRSACRQAAVGVYALRETLAALSIANPVCYVPAMADLVLRRPGSMSPTLRSMPLVGEYASIAGVLATPPQDIAVLESLVRGIAPGATLSDRVVIDALPINYLPGCREHCPLAPYCKARALAAGDPSVLDPRYRELLAPAGTLGRASALLDGTVTADRSPQEQELADRLRAARDAWREAV